MQYLNLKISDLHSDRYVGSEPVDRATWINLLAYCAEQENGGTIRACSEWKRRMWEQVCGVSDDEVKRPSLLWEWKGNDLSVWNYPVDKESIVKRKREYAQLGGRASGEARREAPVEASAKHKLKHKVERKGREGKGKEGKEKEEGLPGLTLPASPEGKPPCPAVAGPAPDLTDDEWIKSLQADKAYAGVDVAKEYARMVQWCQVNKKQPNRRRFINWLNRCDKPMETSPAQGKVESVQKQPAPESQALSANVLMMRNQEELKRTEARLKSLKEGAARNAWGIEYSPTEKVEVRKLTARKAELIDLLGFVT